MLAEQMAAAAAEVEMSHQEDRLLGCQGICPSCMDTGMRECRKSDALMTAELQWMRTLPRALCVLSLATDA